MIELITFVGQKEITLEHSLITVDGGALTLSGVVFEEVKCVFKAIECQSGSGAVFDVSIDSVAFELSNAQFDSCKCTHADSESGAIDITITSTPSPSFPYPVSSFREWWSAQIEYKERGGVVEGNSLKMQMWNGMNFRDCYWKHL